MTAPNGQQIHENTNNEGNANQNREISHLLAWLSQRRQELNDREDMQKRESGTLYEYDLEAPQKK